MIPKHIEYITLEWAKQLIFNELGSELDFATMKMIFVPPFQTSYRIHVWQEAEFIPITSGRVADYSEDDTDEVNIFNFYDHLNLEVTRLGYGKKSNTIALSGTASVNE